MSEHSLPEDLEQWPTNPFELLGIRREATPREARRAYLHLVRAFKPEFHPNEFKKIREAFETVEREIEWRERLGDEEDSSDDSNSAGSPNPEKTLPSENSDALERPWSQQGELHDSLNEIWELACAGNRADAYSRLVALCRKPPVAVGVYQRLYWLLIADPALDSDRTPCDWLCEGLNANRLSGQLLALYRRELQRDPKEAMRPRFDSLLDVDADPSMVGQLLIWRWEAYFRQSSCQWIRQDLDRTRRQFVFDAESHWLRILLNAAGFLAFVPDEFNTFKACQSELEKLANLHRDMDFVFDTMDALVILRKGWNQLRSIEKFPQHWIELIPLGWLDLYEISRSRLIVVLQEMTQSPRMVMNRIDNIVSQSPLAMHQIESLISTHGQRQEKYWQSRDTDDVKMIVRRFLHPRWSTPCHLIREELLEFCLRETIFPEEIARVADEMAREHGSHAWGEALYGDMSMRIICLAHSVFRE